MSSVVNIVSLPTQLRSIPVLNGNNFVEWKEQLLLTLGYLDLEMALEEPKPSTPTDQSSANKREEYSKWIRSNKISLMIMRNSIAKNIRGSFASKDDAKDYLDTIKKSYQTTDKGIIANGVRLMSKLATTKFDGSRSVREHIYEMTNLAAQLKDAEMSISDGYLNQFVLNSLPSEFSLLKVTYNQLQQKWNIHELIAMCDQEERRLKQEGLLAVNVISQKPKKETNDSSKDGGKSTIRKKNGTPKCFYCKKKGHTKKDCIKRKSSFEEKGIPYNPDSN
ncbi:Retrovirus-related Pol polyprotein from transposon TNT 1-94 [Cinnamomum micranthum f. kanehirae]|uniref:Retrovirus-related Pol polyprotein from transposon TNT 1-94 n=1 Tax=Cinnamomum micranthum f. kanehirae TaxID=337451 RepID=A0A3S3N2Q1_9MAGN|nr:Retrovirus-related Pol polyprotein from transposon TNT 1-94 [Cinnamomum micranthum f. kanehirae]